MGIEESFLKELDGLAGLECWGVTGGEGTGSLIGLDLGEKILKKQPSTNNHLSDLVKKYDSTHGFMIHCPWRIESETDILSGSHMSNSNSGVMVKGLRHIRRSVIKNIICIKPSYGMRIEFSNNIFLVVNCSNIGIDYDECYSVSGESGWYTVMYDGKLEFEKNT